MKTPSNCCVTELPKKRSTRYFSLAWEGTFAERCLKRITRGSQTRQALIVPLGTLASSDETDTEYNTANVTGEASSSMHGAKVSCLFDSLTVTA